MAAGRVRVPAAAAAGSSVAASLESGNVITLTTEPPQKTLGVDARVKCPENTLEYERKPKEMTTYCMDGCIAGAALPRRDQLSKVEDVIDTRIRHASLSASSVLMLWWTQVSSYSS